MKIRKIALFMFFVISLLFVAASCAERETYEVKFETYGGSVVESQFVSHDQKATRPGNPTKEGHTFIDWYWEIEDKDGKMKEEIYDFESRIRKPITIYAKWKVNSYTLDFITGVDDYTLRTLTLDYGTAITIPEVDTRYFVLEGHTFTGWYFDEALTNKFENQTMPAANSTLYAGWVKNTHKVTHVYSEDKHVNVNVKYGDPLPTVDAPTKVGYTFDCWLINNEPIPAEYKVYKDVTLTVKWIANEYTITFNSNGGSSVEAQTYEYNAALKAPQTPTKEGYSFAGWYNGETYFDFTNKVMGADDITLTAKWNINSYNVKFDTVGGSAVANTSVVFGEKVTEPAAPTKVGYTFDGWYLNDTKYNFNSSMPASNITLTAKWVANDYKVIFNANGGSGTIATIETAYDKATTAPENTFERIGYSFVKWNTKADGTGTSYNELADIKNVSTGDDVTLYAIWVQNEYTLTISLSETETFTFTFHYGDSIAEKFTEINTDKEDAVFDSWYKLSNNEWVPFDPVGATMPNHDLAVGAKYLGEVTITFIGSNTDIITYTGHESEIIGKNAPTPKTQAGYKFDGWFMDEAFVQEYNLTVYPTTDTTVYAKWIANTITVKFDGNGSTSGSMEDYSFKYDSNNGLPTNAFAKTGYEFKGWSTNKDATDTDDLLTNGSKVNVASEGEVTLYAIWKIRKFTISFDDDFGSVNDPISQDYNSTLTLPVLTDVTGYTFGGWHYENGQPFTSTTMPAENVTLVAKWNPLEYTLTINYTMDGITTVKEISIYHDDKLLSYSDLKDFITLYGHEGYEFKGWFTDPEMSETNRIIFTESDFVSDNIELFTQFDIITYNVKFIVDGVVIYTVKKEYNASISFEDYIIELNALNDAYFELKDGILKLINRLMSPEQLMGIIYKNAAYYQDPTLQSYLENFQATQEFLFALHSYVDTLYSETAMYVEYYENTKEDGQYVPTVDGKFFEEWTLGENTIYNGKKEFVQKVPASTNGSKEVSIVAVFKKLNKVNEIVDAYYQSGNKDEYKNVISWKQIDISQLELENNQTANFNYVIYNLNIDGSLSHLDTIALDKSIPENTVISYKFMTPDTYNIPGDYKLVIKVIAEIIDNETDEVIKSYESELSNTLDLTTTLSASDIVIGKYGDYYQQDEQGNFYFYTNTSLTFKGDHNFQLTEESLAAGKDRYVTMNGNTISVNNEYTSNGVYVEFKDLSKDANTVYKAYILPILEQYSLGKDLSNFVNSNSENSSFRGKNATYTIGKVITTDNVLYDYTNDFKTKNGHDLITYANNGYSFDLNISTTAGKQIDPTSLGGYLVYKFYDLSGKQIDNDAMGTYNASNNSWVFNNAGEYKVVISINSLYIPPRSNAELYEDGFIKPVEFTFTVNESINVYTHEQFKLVYSLQDIKGISLHNNIEAKLDDDQYYDYYNLKNPENPIVSRADNAEKAGHAPIDANLYSKYNIPTDPKEAAKYKTGDVYKRAFTTDLNESFVINGNCFEIDGTKLPYASIHSVGNLSSVPGYNIASLHLGVINYMVSAHVRPDVNPTDTPISSNSKLTVNNIRITGNTTRPTVDYSSNNTSNAIELMSRNSGGYIGVNTYYGSELNINNSIITNTTVGAIASIESTLNVNNTSIIDSWSNGIYCYDPANVSIKNSYIKDCGGAGIHLEDTESYIDTAESPENQMHLTDSILYIDKDTKIENYVTGEEAFFKSRSLEVMIMIMKAQVEQIANSYGWTMLEKNLNSSNQYDSEMLNLMVLLVCREYCLSEEKWGDNNRYQGFGYNAINVVFDSEQTPAYAGAAGLPATNVPAIATILNPTSFNDYVKLTGTDKLETGMLLQVIDMKEAGFGYSMAITGLRGL